MMQMVQQSTIAKPHIQVLISQMGVKEGTKKFGVRGKNALLKELNQLHERNAPLPKRRKKI